MKQLLQEVRRDTGTGHEDESSLKTRCLCNSKPRTLNCHIQPSQVPHHVENKLAYYVTIDVKKEWVESTIRSWRDDRYRHSRQIVSTSEPNAIPEIQSIGASSSRSPYEVFIKMGGSGAAETGLRPTLRGTPI